MKIYKQNSKFSKCEFEGNSTSSKITVGRTLHGTLGITEQNRKSNMYCDKDGFVFTANFTKNGLDKGLEVGVKLSEQQTTDLKQIHANWKNDFQSKAIKYANVKDLKEIEVFKDGKLTKKMLLDENKEDIVTEKAKIDQSKEK